MHPILFEFFGYQIRTYSVAMALGFVVGIFLLRRRALYEQIDPNFTLNAAITTIFGTILGGRALFIITTYAERFADKPWYELFYVWEGGLVFYGGFFGSFFAVWLYARLKKQPILPLFDLFGPYVGLGLAIHRPFGCFMNGCCYGAPTHAPWGVHFPIDSYPTKLYGIEQALHPTQIYMGLSGLFLFLILRWYRKYKLGHGEVVGLLLSIYAVNRFIIEFFRGDPVRGFVPQNEIFGLIAFVVGLALLLLMYKKNSRLGRGVAWLIIFGAVIRATMGMFSDTSVDATMTPFSTSQFIGFYTFAAGAALWTYSRYFGQRVQPEYGKPIPLGSLSPPTEAEQPADA
ncbi:MAG: prolipoprotein diacylglyceryl transferase [Alphaproteobacteria bacterium]